MKELVLGAGHTSNKYLTLDGSNKYHSPVTLDINPLCNPDVVWNLNDRPLPFKDEEFDEIHAYEVLEHIGVQGDYRGFFSEFSEYFRILKKGGHLCASVPKWDSIWAWGDPSHTRIINAGTLSFLSQEAYKSQLGRTAMADFREIYKADFKCVHSSVEKDNYFFILEKV